jgi:hypothetical protein
MMWQCQSNDSGVTWEPAVRTSFPGYTQAMVRLKSGPIIVAKRFPNLSVNISRDDGLNWGEDAVIDYPPWANGCMLEVEPDVVLCVYLNPPGPLLAQRFRVTDEKLIPLDD